jgi:tripartite-type tricarboxylate transporter receptor subunit TctC
MVARAEPDGYTLFNVTNASLAAIPHLMKLGYDAETAFAPVALTGDLYSYLAVNPDLPVADFAQFVAHAKANPGKLNFGSAGNGSLGHLYGELLKLKTGIDIVHVPYRGSAAAILDAVAGRLQVILDPASLPYIQGGKLRGLATLNEQRSPTLPDLPTIAEAGVRGWNARLWFGVVVPAKTPPQIIAFLNGTINAILAEPKTMAQLRDLNIEPRRFTPEEIQKMVREESAFFSDLIRTAKIRVE